MNRRQRTTLQKTLTLSLLAVLMAGCMHKEPATTTVAPVATKPAVVATLKTEAPVLAAAAPAQEPLKRRAAMSRAAAPAAGMASLMNDSLAMPAPSVAGAVWPQAAEARDKYSHYQDNPVNLTGRDAVSTLSLDVDTGSYSHVRRLLNQGHLPPKDAVRIEEMLNYFSYDYPRASGSDPFSITTEVGAAPWNPDHLLLRVGVKAVEKNVAAMPPANLVFLVDVSGSMDEPDKLPLVQASLNMLVEQLRPQDHVALIVYAGRTAVELESTPGNQKQKIRAAIARLQAGGSTAGEAAIRLAYAQARAGYIEGGINRILLATDGDFNVGISDIEQLKSLIEHNRDSGISLTTLGFGQGNYQEPVMQQLADVGNGNYAYVDSLGEARKVLVEELSSTFNTVAGDVKLQMEFNPAQVAEWRLVGYEKRVLREEDFKNDKIDAAEVGAGKSVTALYELTPVGKATLHDRHRYQGDEAGPARGTSSELGFLKIRYKKPGESHSIELSQPVTNAVASKPGADWNFAAAVAGFGQLLRGGDFTGNWNYEDVRRTATQGLGQDAGGYRRDFLRLVNLAAALTPAKPDQVSVQDIRE
jgi:Ca-activated chloride channel family protein